MKTILAVSSKQQSSERLLTNKSAAMFSINVTVFATVACLAALFWQVSIHCQGQADSNVGQGQVMYEWLTVDFDWPTTAMKEQYLRDGRYDPTHNLPSGLKTYRDQVYLSVPRLRYTTGVPSTLNVLVTKNGKTLLRPFPDWESQEIGNCSALQCAMSMEVDPITGYMYVIDPGRAGIFKDPLVKQPEPVVCPPKLVVYNLKDGSLVRSHELPEELVRKETNYLNDIVLDRGDPYARTARWVYITDATDAKLIVFDLETNITRTFYHPTMEADPGAGSDVMVNGRAYRLQVPIDGMAMSADFQYVYYCALGSKDLYQIPSKVLRYNQDFGSKVRYIGAKVSQTGGMTYGTDSLYYGALTRNAVYRWDVVTDEETQGVSESKVVMKTENEIVRDDVRLQWPDSFTIDEYGYLWFTACRAHLFLKGGIDFTGASGPNYRIWRVYVGEHSYLAPKARQQRFG